MPTLFYRRGLEKIITGNINWDTDTIKLALVTSAYTPAQTHEFFTDITNQLTGYTQPTLNCTISRDDVNDRIELQSVDVTINSVGSGQTIGGLIIYKDTGTAGTSPLIGYTTGLNLTTNNGAVDVDFSSEGFLAINRTNA